MTANGGCRGSSNLGNGAGGSLAASSGWAFLSLFGFRRRFVLAAGLRGIGLFFRGPVHVLRQEDGKGGTAMALLSAAAYADPATVFFYDAAADPKTEAGSLLALSGKEWIEYSLQVFR